MKCNNNTRGDDFIITNVVKYIRTKSNNDTTVPMNKE